MRVAPTDKEGDDSDEVPGEKEPEDTHARSSVKAKAGLGDKVDNLDPKYGKPNTFKEETELDEEQLDEISKKLAGSYRHAAAKDRKDMGHQQDLAAIRLGQHLTSGQPKLASRVKLGFNKIQNRIDKRTAGIKAASSRMKAEEVEELDEAHYQMDDSAITTDTLAGRSAGGKANSFKSFKLRVKPLDKEGDGESKEPGCDTPEKTPARASIHAEEVEESFEEEHGIGRDIADKKEKMDRLKTPAKPGPLHNVAKGFKAFIKGKAEPMESVEQDGEQLDEKKDLAPGQDDAPFDPPYTTGKPDNVKDKSGAIHTPMSRARDLARKSLEKVKKDISGKK
jgi:hypothetical protein